MTGNELVRNGVFELPKQVLTGALTPKKVLFMRQPLFHSHDFVGARVVWNTLSVDPDVTPYEALDHDFCDYQSVLFVRFDNGVAMDVMWHPEVKPGGEFAISLNQSLEWDPFIEMRC